MSKKSKIVCLMGPTASGKTALASSLLAYFPLDIISVDSALVYRGMNIGTAKPTTAELALAPHRLIDLCDPSEVFSAGDFCQHALRHIQEILDNRRIPFLVGGTMLYFKSLLAGMTKLPVADTMLRAEIEAEAESKGWAALHHSLQAFDPASYARIHPNDPQRIQRAIEVYRLTGRSLTEWHQSSLSAFPYDVVTIIIEPRDRGLLHARIAERLTQMFDQGFIEEVRLLYQRGDLHADLPAVRCVGYRQVWQYLAGQLDIETCQSKALFATRQLAKRQLTWLRHWPAAKRYWMEDIGEDNQQVMLYLQSMLED